MTKDREIQYDLATNFDNKLIEDQSGNYANPEPIIIRNNIFSNFYDDTGYEWRINIFALGAGNLEIYNNLFLGTNHKHMRLHRDPRKPGKSSSAKIFDNIFMDAPTIIDVDHCFYTLTDKIQNDPGDTDWTGYVKSLESRLYRKRVAD